MYLTSCLHIAQLCDSSPDSPFSLKSKFTNPFHLPPLWSSFPSPPLHIHPHYSPHIIILHTFSWLSLPSLSFFLGYFSNFRCPSNCFLPYYVELCNTTHPSQHPHFCHIQLLLLRFLLISLSLPSFLTHCDSVSLTHTRTHMQAHARMRTHTQSSLCQHGCLCYTFPPDSTDVNEHHI